MSRHFYPPDVDASEQAALRIPRRVYALVDHLEPDLAISSESVLFAFDGVDADQLDALTYQGRPLTLDDPTQAEAFWRRFWADVLGGIVPPLQDDPFEKLDLFRIELVLDRGTDAFGSLVAWLDTDSPKLKTKTTLPWMEFVLGEGCQTPVEVYPRMFGAPLPTFANFGPVSPSRSEALSRSFTIDPLGKVSWERVLQVLGTPGIAADALAVYDVGQGSACALLDAGGHPRLHFDLGCGVYRNAPSRPDAPFNFCTCGGLSPAHATMPHVVLLSHWDADHWAGAFASPHNFQFLKGTWIVPYQGGCPGAPHLAFAYDIVRAGGKLLVYAPPAGQIDSVPLPDDRQLVLVRAGGRDRNDSGFVLCVDDAKATRSWLLTGDGAYQHYLAALGPRIYEAVVVPHHGADLGSRAIVPKPYRPSRRLIFSFGANNAHGRNSRTHPTSAAVAIHDAAGWDMEGWRGVAAAGHREGQADLRATNKNGPGTKRLGGIFVAWGCPNRAAPVPCNAGNCTTSLLQS